MTIEQLAITVTADTESVTVVRHFIRSAQAALGVSVDAAIAELLASELAANAVALSAGEISITARSCGRALRVEVRDFGYGRPEVARPQPSHGEGGRGLMIVDRLADAWGIDEFLPGKIVWFELSAAPTGSVGAPGARAASPYL